jgi:DNA-binding MarR family transcriptional regulator/N-acetylglutamate synthase-like GNAT family acetyltransferase
MPRPAHSAAAAAPRQTVDAIRDFNRFYTRQLGLLGRDYLGSKWTLTEVRVLYEIANSKLAMARSMAGQLQLDEAYLSRILAKFERRGLINRSPAPWDARQQCIRLTPAGQREFAPLNTASADQVANQLTRLKAADKELLVGAMKCIQYLLRDRDGNEPLSQIRPLQIGDCGWIIHRQAKLYAQEYGWDLGYEGLVAGILSEFVRNFDPRRDAAWIAESNGHILGSVFLMHASDRIAKLRLLYVEPAARGASLGRRLVRECIHGAVERGYETLTLWTNDVLASARRIYEAAGFQQIAEEPHHSFGKDLRGQTWELDLRPIRQA